MEDSYYANFIPTAVGRQLDHLGADLGLERRFGYGLGSVTFSLGGEPKPSCLYVLPLGTVVESTAGTLFRTTERAALTTAAPTASAAAVAIRRGPTGNARPSEISRINAEYLRRFVHFPPAGGNVSVRAQNEDPFTGGDELEDDQAFRRRLIDRPRTIWTAESLRQSALDVDGVRDCIVWDPYGGLDRTADWFGSFKFKQRMLSSERDLCSPYFFDLVVAPEPGAVWEGSANLPGVRDDVEDALADKRPISIFPNILRACQVEVAATARILMAAGHDPLSVVAEVRRRVAAYIFGLRLGDDVVAAEVSCAVMSVPGVVDVQDLRLSRCPPRFGVVVFCKQLAFQDQPIMTGCGENITLATGEIAVVAPTGLEFTFSVVST
jgi:phage-related baseplate assembly protein